MQPRSELGGPPATDAVAKYTIAPYGSTESENQGDEDAGRAEGTAAAATDVQVAPQVAHGEGAHGGDCIGEQERQVPPQSLKRRRTSSFDDLTDLWHCVGAYQRAKHAAQKSTA